MLQDGVRLSEKEVVQVSDTYTKFYKWRSYRSGIVKHFRNYQFEDMLKLSRELFWNSVNTPSDDLNKLNLDLSLPFARKETLDLLGRVASLGYMPKMQGDDLSSLGVKVLQGIYKHWSFKANMKVETFWDLLYGFVNGTVCSYIGYNNEERQRRYLTSYDAEAGTYKIDEKKEKYWNDVVKEIVPIEDIYLPKIYERNFQKQGRILWKKQMDEEDFKDEFGKYPLSKYVFPGHRIAEDSLFFRLLGGTGTTTATKIEVMRDYDWVKDEYRLIAGGLVLNKVGRSSSFEWSPMPFNHKMGPFTWGIMGPLDEKLAYGLPTPFAIKDPHKMLNTMFTMGIERELRAVDPVILSSDIESPDLIYGQHKVVGVNDVNAYKEFKIAEPSPQFMNVMNALQNNMSSDAQGGDAAIVPSKQPKSARETVEIQQMKQQAMTNITTMYYDILRQQVMLVLKTALQFYPLDKYESSDGTAIRTLMAHEMPLSTGGVGSMKIRIVKEKKPDMELFLESIKDSILNGKTTEIVEVPEEFLKNLDFLITDIELDPSSANALEKADFVDNIINPMLKAYVPMGLADGAKVMQRHLEKYGESISDYAPEQVLQDLAGKGTAKSNMPPQPGQPAQSNPGQQSGNMGQSTTGMQFGMNNVNGKSAPLPLNR